MAGPISNNVSTPVTQPGRAQGAKGPDAAALSQDGLATTYTVDSRVLTSVPNPPADSGTPPAYPSAKEALRRNEILESQQQIYIDPTLNASARTILGDLKNQGIKPVDIWQGSQIVFKGDGGQLLSGWTASPQQATATQGPNGQQYEIKTGFRDTAIALGKTPQGDTWVQFVRHGSAPQSVGDKVRGALGLKQTPQAQDLAIAKKTGQAVGPLGLSPHTAANPVLFTQGDN